MKEMQVRFGKVIIFVLSIGLFTTVIFPQISQASSKDQVSVKRFVTVLKEIVNEKGAGELVLEEEDSVNMAEFLTWKEAAVLIAHAEQLINGEASDQELYTQVKKKDRLTGLKGLTVQQKNAAVNCFIRGIIVGDSKGTYSQSRKFRANDFVTKAEMKKIVQRLKDKKKRIKLSPDGQVIRTTNLPKNYKSYNYILASFPNEFYEMKFMYQKTKYYYKPKNLIDYASPKNFTKVSWTGMHGKENNKDLFEEYGDSWCDLIKKNLEYRLNFDYRTVNNTWISGLRDTYYSYKNDAELNKGTTDRITNYVKAAKKNKVTVKADKIVVEPSTMYYKQSAGTYVRCYIKFKVTANTIYAAKSFKQHELIFSDMEHTYFRNLKNGKWYEAVCDVSIASRWGDTGADYKMEWDILGKE